MLSDYFADLLWWDNKDEGRLVAVRNRPERKSRKWEVVEWTPNGGDLILRTMASLAWAVEYALLEAHRVGR